MPKRMQWAVAGLVAIALAGAGVFYALSESNTVPETVQQTAAAPEAARAPKVDIAEDAPAESEPEEAAVAPETEASAASAPSTAERATRQGRGRIYGKAVLPTDARGLPVTVALHLVDSKSPEVSYDDNLVGKAETATEGAFEFSGLPLGEYIVLASATGYTINGAARLTPERVERELTLNLVPGGAIAGRVVNQNQEPVAGAHVFVGGWNIQGQKSNAPRDRALASQRVTDATGAFTLENLRKSLNNEPGYQLAVKAEGYATLVSDYIQAGAQGITLVVKPGAVVSGRLIAADTGEALPDKTISLDSTLSVEKLTGETDAEGFFFVTDVPAGLQTASLRDDELVLLPESARIQVADGAPTDDVELKAAAGGKVSGRVYNSETGGGIGNVKVHARVTNAEDAAPKDITTNSEGAYALKGLKPGAYRVEYEKPEGYPENYRDPDRQRLVTAELGKETAGVDFALTRGLLITGLVVDEAGKPVAQAYVNGHASRGGGGQDNSQSREDGSFVLAGFSVGQEVNVSGGKDGYALLSAEPATGKVTVAEGGASGVKLVLGQAGSISGTVITKAGRPVPGIQLWVRSLSQVANGSPIENSGADGSVTFTRLAPGEYVFNFNGMPSNEGSKRHRKSRYAKANKSKASKSSTPNWADSRFPGASKTPRATESPAPK